MGYFSNRFPSVPDNGYNSDYHVINAGVPQASIFALTLFLLFLNDCFSFTSTTIYIYVDDFNVYVSVQALTTEQQKA